MTMYRLLAGEARRICPGMPVPSPRLFAILAASLLLAVPAMAQTTKTAKPAPAAVAGKPTASAPQVAAGPKQIGKFDDWIAATHQESGTLVCYAFTRVQSSSPAVAGRDKGKVIITITLRPTLPIAVAMEAGFPYADKAAVKVQVDQTKLDFYTDKRNAFARDGKAVAAAFAKGSKAVAHSPGPHNTEVLDTFSLKGFTPAYAAINKACPPK